MKKIIPVIVILIAIFIFVIIFTNKEREYTVSYELNGFSIIEKYDFNYYTFNVKKDDIELDFAFDHKYTTKRKIVEEVKCDDEDDNKKLCSLRAFDETKFISVKENKLYSLFYGSNSDYNDKVLNTVDNINLYDDLSTILVWDSYGFKDITNNKEYNFIDKEQYDNPLTYQYDNYLIVPDYNQSKTFNVFYVIDIKEKKMSKWKLKYNISFNSYFLGDNNGLVYLFDRDNEREYTLDIIKKKIKKVSDSNGGISYEGRVVNYSLSDLKYKDIHFKNNKLENYTIKDNKLYLNYYGSTKNIELVYNLEVKSIVSTAKYGLYVLSGDSIYHVYEGGNYRKVASYFEWNFSTNNKVFCFLNQE